MDFAFDDDSTKRDPVQREASSIDIAEVELSEGNQSIVSDENLMMCPRVLALQFADFGVEL